MFVKIKLEIRTYKGIIEMKIEIEIGEDLLKWIIDSLYANLDEDNLVQIGFIEYLESEQYEN